MWIAAALLLCIFHVLQACWDKIHDKDTGLSTPERRAEAMGEIRAIVYMKTEGTPVEISSTLGRNIKVIQQKMRASKSQSYANEAIYILSLQAFLEQYNDVPALTEYFLKTWASSAQRIKSWCTAFRQHLPIGAHDTNNIIEANNRVVKLCVFNYIKAFNIVHCAKLMIEKVDSIYADRILSMLNRKFDLQVSMIIEQPQVH